MRDLKDALFLLKHTPSFQYKKYFFCSFLYRFYILGKAICEVIYMGSCPHPKPKRPPVVEDLRINPEKRLCPSYDYLAIAQYRVADRDKMGVRVVDNICEEHIM